MPISVSKKQVFKARNLPNLFDLPISEFHPKRITPRNSLTKKRTIPFCPIAKRILYAIENKPLDTPLVVSEIGFLPKLIWSFLIDAEIAYTVNVRSGTLESLSDTLTVIIPCGHDFTDTAIANLCTIIRAKFIDEIILLRLILQKTPHGGISQNKIIRTMLDRYNLTDIMSEDAVIKACQREMERTHKLGFAIH